MVHFMLYVPHLNLKKNLLGQFTALTPHYLITRWLHQLPTPTLCPYMLLKPSCGASFSLGKVQTPSLALELP